MESLVSKKFENIGKMLTILTTYNPLSFDLSGMKCEEANGTRLFWDSKSDYGNGRMPVVKTSYGLLGAMDYGSYVIPTGVIAVRPYTNSVLLASELQVEEVLPDLLEDTLFQASLVYEPEMLQRLVDYTFIHQLGITAYINFGSPYFEHFMYKVAYCERMYKDA